MRRWPVLLLALCTLTGVGGPHADVPADEPLPAAEELHYRRVLVPQDRIAEHTRGFLPMERASFQQLLQQIQSRRQSSSADVAWIESAEYQAVFSEGQLIDGLARLRIMHEAVQPTVLSLAPCSLAIGAATWQHAETTQPAVVGTDETGDLLTLVGSSGELLLPWTLRGVTGEWGECRFELSLASAPLSRLVIDLPRDLVLSTDRGLVTPPDAAENETGAVPAGPVGLQPWIIQLGGHSRCVLTVAPRQADHRRQQFVSVQQNTTYRLMDDGLEVECDVELAIHRAPLNELVFEVDPDLQITAVRLGNLDVNWVAAASEDARSQTVRMRFAERLTGVHPTLQLFAVGPLHTGESWRLPTLRPQNVFWRQGTMSLVVPESLELRHLSVHNARQAGMAAPQDGLAGEVTRFELFGVDAALEVNIARQGRELVADVGTTIDLDPGAVTSQTLADVRCRFGERFVMEARVPNAWTIDGIEAQPANAVSDYQFVAYEAGHKRLQIQLAQPLTPERSIRLAVRAHRTPSSWFAAEDFRPVEFLDVAQASRLVAIAPDASYRLDLVGDDGLDRVDPDSLSPAEAARLLPRRGGVVFVDNERADRLTINVTREDPEFAAVVWVDADVDPNVLAETYRVECTPESTPVSQLRIHLSETRPTPVTWHYVGAGNAILGARLLTEEQQTPASLQRSGETWEVSLRTPAATTFEIRGQRRTRLESALPVSLATLPAAVSHEGRLTIHSLGGTRLSIQANSVRPIPCEPAPPDRCPTAVAAYQYDASRNARVIIDRAPQRVGPSPVWAWKCEMTSQFLETGRATHRATFLLESSGGTQFQLRLPAGSELRSLDINAIDSTRSLRSAADGFQTVTLPAGNRFPRVELRYETAGPPLGIWSRLAVEFPQLNVPVLDRRWSLWLPPGYLPSAGNRDVLGPPALPMGWKQRLFGPLAARADEQPFDIFSAEDWSRIWGHSNPQPESGAHAEAFLQWLGESMLAADADRGRPVLTWRELFAQYVQRTSEQRLATTAWVDAAGLAEEGFRLESVLPPCQEGSPVEVATSMLAAAHLAAVERGNRVLLISRSRLAPGRSASITPHSSSVDAPRDERGGGSDPGSLPDWPLPGTIPLAAWVAPPASPEPPWNGRRDDLRSGLPGRTWRSWEIRVHDTGYCELSVQHAGSLGVIGWSVLLAVAGIVGGWGRQLGRGVFPFLVTAAVLAMLVPAGLVPLTSSLFLGALGGVVIMLLVRCVPMLRDESTAPADLPASPSPAALTAMVLVAVCFVWGIRVLRADPQPQVAPAARADTTYPLVVPVDADLAPVGQYDYLPLEFYDAIHRRAREPHGSHRNWLVTRATYRAVFNWLQQRSLLDLTTITATYQLEMLQSLARFEFPWDGKAGGIELLEARLDGQPVELNWNAQRTGVVLPPPSVGLHQLELVLRPATREEPGERSLRFGVLPAACAHLQIEVPFGAPGIQLPSALGSVSVDPVTGVHHAELGPVKQLELRWRPGPVEEITPRPTDVQQLAWLKVRPKGQPEAVILDSMFRMQTAGRQIREVKLRVDSRLRLLADPSPAFEYVEEPVTNSGDRPVTIRWPEPGRSDPQLRLQFQVTNTTGLGNVSLPRLEFVDARVTQRWLAVSVSPDLEFVPGTSDLFSPLDASEFLTMWGEAESAPDTCYRVSAEDPGWSLATRSRQSRSESRQSLDVSVGREKLDLAFEAEVATANGEVFQHRLSVPREFQLGTIAVTVGETDICRSAHHDGSGTVTVFLRRGVAGAHRLSLRGFLPVASGTEQFPLPSVSLVDTAVASHAVRIYRQANVLVDVQTPPDLKPLSQIAVGTFRESFGRLVSAFELTAAGITSSGGVILNLRDNQPRLDVRLVTTLRRVQDSWEAIADFDARVAADAGGLVDRFRFEIPPEWTGPFTVEPDVPYEIRMIPGQRRHLVLRPWQPVADQIHLSIRGLLELDAHERGRTPNIVPLDASSTERYFVLPTQLDEQRINWETPGLVEVPLRDAVPEGTADAAAQVAYRVWAKPRAVIADVQRVARERQISLADVYFDCRAGQRCFGVVSFAIEPAGAATCTLQIPPHLDLVQASMEGVPATMVPLGDRRWHVRLASEQLPQQLTLVFQGELPRPVDRQPQQIAVPWIVDLDVVRTLWTLRGPVGGTLASEDDERHRIDVVPQESLRLRTMADVVASAAETVLDSPVGDVQAWYTPWAIRLACARARISQDRWLDQRDDRSHGFDMAEVDTILQDQDTIAQRLKVLPKIADYVRQTNRYAESRDIWDFNGRGATVASHYSYIGQVPGLALSWQPDPGRSRWPSLLAAVGLVGLAVGLWSLVRRGTVTSWWRQWPYAAGVLGGIAWWLLASPSLLGWVAVAVSLWGAIRWPFVPQPLPVVNVENAPESRPDGI